MATITEDFVSFETAKLLKEKGFNEECFALYNPDGVLIQSGIRLNNIQVGRVKGSYSAPTLQMAMKWLREVHNIHIDIDPEWTSKGGFSVIGYCFNIHSIVNPWYEDFVIYPTYEQAVEAANKYCLENLI